MLRRLLGPRTAERLPIAGAFAAEMAFYFALSFMPLLGLTAMAATAWLPPALGEALAAGLIDVFPPEANLEPAAITSWVHSVRGSGWLAASVLLAVWTSFRFMATCVRALRYLGGQQDATWSLRLKGFASSAFLLVVWMATLLLAAFLVCLGPAMESALADLPGLRSPEAALTVGRQVLLGLVLVGAMRVTYGAVPGLGGSRRQRWVGAVIAALGWLGSGWVFTRLVPVLWHDHALYGALASFMLFLLWAQTNAWLLLAGGQLAAGRK